MHKELRSFRRCQVRCLAGWLVGMVVLGMLFALGGS